MDQNKDNQNSLKGDKLNKLPEGMQLNRNPSLDRGTVDKLIVHPVQAAVIAVIEYANVYGTEHLRIGDEVIMNMDKDARGWGRPGVPDGTKGTVMGFFEYYSTSNYNQGKIPGIYRGNGAAYVKWEDGSVSTEGSDVTMPKHLLEQRRKDKTHNDAFKEMIRLYDLPKFDYMVGNKIAFAFKHVRQMHRQPVREIGTITAIDFDQIIERRTGHLRNMEQWHNDRIFHVDLEEGGSTRVSMSEIDELVEKGNYWAWLNDKSQLAFKDLQAECVFYATLGKRTQLRSPRSGDYKWTLDDAVEALRHGDVDGIGNSGSFFGSTPFPTVYKFDEDLADLAARTRAKSIEGFAEHVIGERPNRKYEVRYSREDGTQVTATKEFASSEYIPPSEDKIFVIDGNPFKVIPTYNLDEKEDDPVVFSSPVLETSPAGNSYETSVAYFFFDRLQAQGWTVNVSQVVPDNK